MSSPVHIGHVVEEFMQGNATIKICDDAYRDKTPEDIERIMARIMEISWTIVRQARAAGKDI